MGQLDLPVDDQLGWPHVDVIARSPAQVFREQPGRVVFEIQLEACLFQSLIEFRVSLQQKLERIWRKEELTMILVTHDLEDAIFLADRVLVLMIRARFPA